MADSFVGQKIKDIRPMTSAEHEAECWDEDNFNIPVVVELENGAKLYASRDPEGNGAGAMFAMDEKGNQLQFGFARK
jgi:hypothetical protein